MTGSRIPRVGTILGAALGLALLGTGFVATPLNRWLPGGSDDNKAQIATDEPSTTLVSVVDLVDKIEVDGTLTAANTVPVVGQSQGTITSVVAAGQELAAGDVIYAVDEVPVVYLPGATPAWRTMEADSVGADVEQLEQALVLMGYDTAGDLSVDETYTSYTAELVSHWQEDVGLEATGVVEFGSVVFAPADADGRSVVASVSAGPGDQAAGTPIAVLSDGLQQVEFAVDFDQAQGLAPRTEVEVRLPDRTVVQATVSSLKVLDGGQSLVNAELGTDSSVDNTPGALTDLPVTVSWESAVAKQVTTVPAAALIRHDDGSYVVTVINEDVQRVVPVIPGAAADRVVEVSGDLAAGDLVVVP